MRRVIDDLPRCVCGQVIGWTRVIRGLPCDACLLRRAKEKARLI